MKHARKDYDRIQDPANFIGKDEPVFLIRARDTVSWAAVEAWANLAEMVGADKNTLDAARGQAAKMRVWQFKNRHHIPDM